MQVKTTWVTPPDALAKAIEDYAERALVAVHAAASYVGQKMQNEARANAPWENRTSNARSGLFYAVEGFGLPVLTGEVSAGAMAQKTDVATVSGSKDRLVIVVGHTVFYGKFLELCNGGRYAIVMSTMENNLPVLERMLKDLFRG